MYKYIAVLLSFSCLAIVHLGEPPLEEFRQLLQDSFFLHVLAMVGMVSMSCTVFFYGWLAGYALRYRPVAGVMDEELPMVTIVVPAYNEGRLVQQTLYSLVTGDYPAEKMQLIAVDDGSQDDTWHWIQAAKRDYPDRITTLRLLKNSGKRRALYEGFTRATGDVLVTVDSDSIVDPETIRNLVSPFVVHKECGAVAGNVRVLNREGIIPKMLDVSFVFSFEFVRSAQSVMHSVLCTPGALAAYRRESVMKVLNEWLTQRFFGKVANIGEDRALTNMILKQGYSVLFQSNAVVYTNVPSRMKNLCKMFIRWGRSNVRENLNMHRYVFSNFRSYRRGCPRILLMVQHLWVFSSPMLMLLSLTLFLLFPMQLLLTAMAGGALWSSIPALFYGWKYGWRDALWSYGYSIFHFVCLFWITPYSLFTMSRSGWLTRTLQPPKPMTAVRGK